MDPKQNQNFLIAIALSMMVLIAWQVFYAMPKMREEQARRDLIEQAQKKAEQAKAQASGSGQTTQPVPAAPGTAPQAASASAAPDANTIIYPQAVPRDVALKRSVRVAIDTPAISGSIALTGARFDDVVFKKYKQTVAPGSPNEIFMSPAGVDHAHFVDYAYALDGQPFVGPDAGWTLAVGTTLTPTTPITLALDTGKGVKIKRSIAVDDRYMFTISDEIENSSGRSVALQPITRMYKVGEPKVMPQWMLHEGFIGFTGSQGVLEWTWASVKDKAQAFEAKGGWVGITDKYFASVFVPPQDQASRFDFKHFTPGAGYYQADYQQAPMAIADGTKATMKSQLFIGAKEVHVIDQYAEAYGIPKFNYLMDWGWFYFITQPMFYLIDWLYRLIGNFGLAILAVTVIVKAAFYPLANRAYESMAKMKLLQPEMVKIQERYKDDRQKQQQAMMELYKTQKVNPVAGCVPVLLQIPVFFALYKVLFVTIEMRHAPFYGWIKDLSAPDPTNVFNLFGLLPYEIPQSVPLLHLGVWPIIMGITMWLQMQLNPPPPDPVQARIFAWMPIVFTFTLGLFPAGLVIYWAWNNLLTILQQYVIMKRQGAPVEIIDNMAKSLGFVKASPPATPALAAGPAAESEAPRSDMGSSPQQHNSRKRTPKKKKGR